MTHVLIPTHRLLLQEVDFQGVARDTPLSFHARMAVSEAALEVNTIVGAVLVSISAPVVTRPDESSNTYRGGRVMA